MVANKNKLAQAKKEMEDSQKELALATKAREAEDAELNQSADAHIVNSSE